VNAVTSEIRQGAIAGSIGSREGIEHEHEHEHEHVNEHVDGSRQFVDVDVLVSRSITSSLGSSSTS
jgi:hypothetical protein